MLRLISDMLPQISCTLAVCVCVCVAGVGEGRLEGETWEREGKANVKTMTG